MNQHIKLTTDNTMFTINIRHSKNSEYQISPIKTLLYISLIILSVLLSSCHNKKAEPAIAAAIASENYITLTPAQMKNANIVTGNFSLQQVASVLKVNAK